MPSTPIPFATKSYRRDSAFTPELICRNLIPEKDESASDTDSTMLLQRPGLTALATAAGPIQGLYTPNNATVGFPQTVVVAGNVVYNLVGNALTQVGTITGSDVRVRIIGNFDRVLIVADGTLYMYGASSASTDITFRAVEVPTPYTAVDATMDNDYFVIAMSSGVYYWLVPGGDSLATDGSGSDTDPALHFATAQSQPDGLVGVGLLNGNLVFLGQISFETWQSTTSDEQPWERMPQSGATRGCLSRDTIQTVDNTLFWVGEDGKVYRMSSVPQHISTTTIEERIKERSGDISALQFSIAGHLFYILNIPGEGSFAYDVVTSNWTEFASEGYDTWRPHVSTNIQDTVYVGDSQTGSIWTLSDSPTDDGVPIRRTVTANVPISGRPDRVDAFAVDIGASGAGELMFSWADADEILADQPAVAIDLAVGVDSYSVRRLGLARQPYRQFCLECTDPITIRISGARVGPDVWH